MLYWNKYVKSMVRYNVHRCFNTKVLPKAAARLVDGFFVSRIMYAIEILRNSTGLEPEALTSVLFFNSN